jgi:hypothetical protein
MSLRLLNKIHQITPAVAITALCFGAGCITSEEDLASSEDPLGLVPGYTGYLVVRDFNEDNRPDVAAINVVGSSFAVRLNTGTGTFHNVVHYAVGVQPTFIATGDFDEDLVLDAVVINATTSNISILLGQGNGSFQPAQNQSIADPLNGQIAAAPFGVVTGDFNNDGDIDIVTSNVGTNNISSLLGNGDGTFQSPTTYPLMGPSSLGFVPFPLVTLDFNGDGNLDLVSGGAAHIVMLLGHGDGSFTAIGNYPTGVAMTCIETADFNRDGILDLLTTAMGSSNYSVLLGNGNGTFTFHESKWSGGIAGECFGIGDLNEDTKLDLAIVNSTSLFGTGNVSVLLGDGEGSFGNPRSYSLGVTPWAASIDDFNGDGDLDVAACNGGGSSVSLLFGDGDGTLQPRINYSM